MKDQPNKKPASTLTALESASSHSSSPASFVRANGKAKQKQSFKISSHKEEEIFSHLSQNLIHLEQKAAFLNFTIQEIIDLVG